MKRTFLFISAALLSMLALTTFTSCGDDEDDNIIVNPNGGNNNGGSNNGGSNNDNQQNQEIVVTIDANGNADGGHQFGIIDNKTFHIDGLKYRISTEENGTLILTVTGYYSGFFTGAANIISVLNYSGKTYYVTSIASDAFHGCDGLTSVVIGSRITKMGGEAFCDCENLTSVTISNGATRIGTEAFSGCSSLTSITIPESVTSIGGSAFSYCSSLTSIKVETGNPTYDSRDNCNAIIETATNTLIAGCKNTTIPKSVTRIGGSAFNGCTGITSITIPGSVTSIGSGAFSGCTGLTDVYCYAENVPNTSSYAFIYDNHYYIPNTPISSATLHVPAGSVDAYVAAYPWKNFGSIVAIE